MKLRLTAIATTLVLSSTVGHATDCKKILGLHGFKAQAQVSCGYGQRPNEAIDWAKSCARKQNPGVNMSEINMGATVFKVAEVKMGHEALCQDVLQKFPGVFTQN